MRLIIGSRKSDLARLQARHIGQLLQKTHPNLVVEYDFSESLGDKNLSDPLWKAPEKGVFTSDLAESLEKRSVDLVVHSWKDMPVEISPVRKVVGTCRRVDPRDLLLVKKNSLSRIREKKMIEIFSSSPRREYCLTKYLPELWPHALTEIHVTSVRGNIPTRLRKLMESPEIDALAVAKAALDRLVGSSEEEFRTVGEQLKTWLEQCEWMVLPLSTFPTAPAQGALALEILTDRRDLERLLEPIIDFPETLKVQQEREVLKSYGGGCHQKIGCSVLNSRSGVTVQFLIGKTDQGVELCKKGILNPKEKSSDPVWSTKNWEKHKARAALPMPMLSADAILISKAEALPISWKPGKDQILWCAGLQTWKKLAKAGFWIHGCADGLGLEEPSLEFLGRNLKSFIVVTHQRAALPEKALPTYEIHWATPPEKPTLSINQPIYIRSRMDFEKAQEFGLFDQPRIVYCGLGETFLFLEKNKHLFAELRAVLSEEDL